MKEITIREKSFINATAVAVQGDRVFFSDRKYNALYEMDLDKKTTSICGVFSRPRNHILAGRINNKLMWFPESNRCDAVDVFDIEKNEFSEIRIEPENEIEENRRFSRLIYSDRYLYVLPCVSTSWLQIDINTEQIKQCKVPDAMKDAIILGAATDGENIYMCGRSPLSIYRMDEGGEWTTLCYDKSYEYVFENLYIEDDAIYVIPRNISNRWVKMDKSGKIVETIDFGLSNHADYYAHAQMENEILCLPHYGKTGYFIDLKKKKAEEILLNDKTNRDNYYYWSCATCNKGKLIFPSEGDAPILIVDSEGNIKEIGVSEKNRDLQALLSMIGVKVDV